MAARWNLGCPARRAPAGWGVLQARRCSPDDPGRSPAGSARWPAPTEARPAHICCSAPAGCVTSHRCGGGSQCRRFRGLTQATHPSSADAAAAALPQPVHGVCGGGPRRRVCLHALRDEVSHLLQQRGGAGMHMTVGGGAGTRAALGSSSCGGGRAHWHWPAVGPTQAALSMCSPPAHARLGAVLGHGRHAPVAAPADDVARGDLNQQQPQAVQIGSQRAALAQQLLRGCMRGAGGGGERRCGCLRAARHDWRRRPWMRFPVT